jgi:hypothetical protein
MTDTTMTLQDAALFSELGHAQAIARTPLLGALRKQESRHKPFRGNRGDLKKGAITYAKAK